MRYHTNLYTLQCHNTNKTCENGTRNKYVISCIVSPSNHLSTSNTIENHQLAGVGMLVEQREKNYMNMSEVKNKCESLNRTNRTSHKFKLVVSIYDVQANV